MPLAAAPLVPPCLPDRLASGDDFARLRAVVARAVARVCPASLRHQSDNLVQSAMIRLMAIVRAQPAPRIFNATYVRKVVRSAVVTEIRRARVRLEVPLADDSDERVGDPRAVNPERALARRRIASAIDSSLLGLCEARRIAVTLYLRGHGVSEAARLLGWDPKKTENAVLRGLRDLRSALTRCGVGPI